MLNIHVPTVDDEIDMHVDSEDTEKHLNGM